MSMNEPPFRCPPKSSPLRLELDAMLEGRKFKIWEYWITHQMLLIRSSNYFHKDNVDIVCSGVAHVSMTSELGEVELSDVDTRDVDYLAKASGLDCANLGILKVMSQGLPQYVVCHQFRISTHDGNPMSSPFPRFGQKKVWQVIA